MILKAFWSLLYLLIIRANESNPDGADLCRCFCCPSEINPYKDKAAACDPHNPPLVGTVLIGAGAGNLACNALACSGYFSIECPPAGMKSSRGAAVIAGCKSCSDGPYGNGSSSKGDQSDIEHSLKDYVDKGWAFPSLDFLSE